MGAVQAEADGAAVAGTFELHGDLRECVSNLPKPSRWQCRTGAGPVVGLGKTVQAFGY
nr:hypothetical protein FFPRI1PSEUD_30730 [Pseudomonas sp. FFPRI_1]